MYGDHRSIRRAAVAVIRERDRIFTIASLPAFGLWSMFAPTPSMAALPGPAAWATYALFVLGGALLAVGSFAPSMQAFIIGHIVVIGVVLTVAGVIAFTSESPVSVLIVGYATALSYSLQRALRERALLREVATRAAAPPGDHHE